MADIVNGEDIRVIQGCDRARLLRKARPPDRIGCHGIGQKLQRHVAVQAKVACTEHFTHAAGAERRDDLIRSKASAQFYRHFDSG